jgi:shikimate kinase
MTMKHIFLYGPPGTGKSTIGKALARNLELPFIDLDRVIETNAGMSIPRIMELQGESAFRDLEIAALKKAINNHESVIALGGGSLLSDNNRAMVEKNGRIVLLTAGLDILLKRLNADFNERPLLAGNSTNPFPCKLTRHTRRKNLPGKCKSRLDIFT